MMNDKLQIQITRDSLYLRMRKLSMDELNRKSVDEFREAEKRPMVVVLDNVRSMHNVGSVFRTADAFLIETDLPVRVYTTPAASRY